MTVKPTQQRLPVRFNRRDIREAYMMISEIVIHTGLDLMKGASIQSRLLATDYVPSPFRPTIVCEKGSKAFPDYPLNFRSAFINGWLHHLREQGLPLAVLQNLIDDWDMDEVLAVLGDTPNLALHRCTKDGLTYWGLASSTHKTPPFLDYDDLTTNLAGALMSPYPVILHDA